MRASYTRSKRDRPRAARAIPAARGNPALSKNALLIIAMARRLAAGDRWFESSSLQWLDADQQTQIMKDTGCAIGPTSVAMLVLAGWLPHGGDLILAPHTTHASRDIGRS